MGDKKAECNIPDAAKGDSLPSRTRCSCRCALSPLGLRTLSASLMLLGLLILLVSVSTDNWMGDGRLSVGLWSACMQPGCAADDESLNSGKETIVITRSMLVTAAVCACASVFIISISFYQHRIYTFSLGRISSFTSFFASILVTIGMSVYTKQLLEYEGLVLEAEWSFDAGWASFPLLFLAGSVAVKLSCIES